ncbi:DUF4224 domain-containing protein [Castellaniella sp.]|uniref:DUF4224 domain-containing protein n=1 Tax=Castellaniella sp. TaxID=1955812 RepID=UPI003C722E9A
MSERLHLTQAEVDEICFPLTQGGAQYRHLKSMGVPVKKKPSGRPLVVRSEYVRFMAARESTDESFVDSRGGPDVQGFMKFISERKNGKKAQGQRPGLARARLP